MFLSALVIGAIASGLFAVYQLIKLVWSWVKEKIREKRTKEDADKFLVITTKKLREEAELNLSFDDIESIVQLEREGKTHLIFGTDRIGNMTGKVDLIEAKDGEDETVSKHLRQGGGMFIIK